MVNRRVTWRKRLYNKTPFYATVAGYVFGLSILLGAASTWFIESDIYCQGAGVIHPAKTQVAYPRESVLVSWVMQPGDKVEEGQAVGEVIEEAVAVADYKLRHHLTDAIADLEVLGSEKADGQLETVAADFIWCAGGQPASGVSAPVSGWVEDVERDVGGNGKPKGLMEAGARLFSVADLQEATLEISVAIKRVPTVVAGDSVSMLLAEWDKKYLQGTVGSVKSTLSAQIPRTKFDADEMAVLAKGHLDSAEIYGGLVQCTYSVLEESVKIDLDAGQFSSEKRGKVKGGGTLRLSIPSLNGKQIKTKWDMVSSSLSVVIAEESISPSVRQNLEEHLKEGVSAISVSRCWVEVGTQKLFSRLFAK